MATPGSHVFPDSSLKRQDFPKGFLFGASASAFQYEGAVDKDGRGPSIWDTFLKEKYPDIVESGGLEAIEHYYQYKDDVRVIKETGLDSYRFSISWPRILPKGRRFVPVFGEEMIEAGINEAGIDFYNDLINELLANGIEPMVTLYHWDVPQELENEYLGFLDKRIVCDFADYADLCFSRFGDRVKHWITFNEPWSFSVGGYTLGTFAPGRGAASNERAEMIFDLPTSRATSRQASIDTGAPKEGNPGTEPYIVSHHQLLAHAAAVKLYREKYQRRQKGKIGITLVSNWTVPYHDTQEDQDAAQRALDFMFGWFMDPITYGDYPSTMRSLVGPRLPRFSIIESECLKGSFDFLGFNYYTANYVKNAPNSGSDNLQNAHYKLDSQAECTPVRNGVPIGERAASDWLYVYPKGILEHVDYIRQNYNNPPIYITENGRDELNQKDLSYWISLFDHKRISYHYRHLQFLKKAIANGANVKGYFVWSLMDNLEWSSGFKTRFGMNFIDFNQGLKRYPKLSSGWFKLFLHEDVEPKAEEL